jgi:threonine/homoserine/homoserine lactone efflux protein
LAESVRGVLSFAAAMALSPLPIVAVILLLASARGRAKGLLFELGWLTGLTSLGALVLLIVHPSDDRSPGSSPGWGSWLAVSLGVLLLLLSAQQYRRRPPAGTRVPTPKWVRSLDRLSPGGAFAFGAAVAVVNPKNGPLLVAGAAEIASGRTSSASQATALAIFVLLASAGVFAPFVLHLIAGARAVVTLEGWRRWFTQHNAAVTALVALLLGLKLLLDGLRPLF